MGPNTAAAQSNASETQPAELESLVRQMAETLLKSRRRASVSLPSFPPATLFWPAAYSAGLMLSFLFIHTHLMQPVQDATLYTYYSVDAIRQKVWETDWITPAILLTFLFGTFYLRSIWRSKHTYLSKAEHSHFYKAVLTGQLGLVRIAIESAEHAATLDYYGARLHALINRWRDDADLPAVQALKNEILEIDEQDIVHSFVPIVWCETTLPLLGFLGTVVGIGAAIGSISEAIKILLRSAAESGGSQLDILFNRGFENMALAFDTTFFGLFFLLCLGLFHIYVRRALAIRLDNARRFYSLALTQLPQGSGNLMKGLIERVTAVEGTLGIIDNNSKAGLKGVNDRVEAVERTLRTINEESTAYKERVEGLVDHVIMEVPEFAGIRKALMKPVVEFTVARWPVEERLDGGFRRAVAVDVRVERRRQPQPASRLRPPPLSGRTSPPSPSARSPDPSCAGGHR